MGSKAQQGKSIQSVQRAIDILNCFSKVNTELSLGEISAMLELNKGTVHGIINTLRNNDYICQNRMGKYLLGPALFSKGGYMNDTIMALFADVARQEMQELSNKYMTTGSLFAVQNGFLYLVHSSDPRNALFLLHRARPEMPLHATASGKLMLAFETEQRREELLSRLEFSRFAPSTITSEELLRQELADIRALGYSYEREELFEGVSSISMPVLCRKELFGTLSMSGMSSNIARNQQHLVLDLKRVTENISRTISSFSDGVGGSRSTGPGPDGVE